MKNIYEDIKKFFWDRYEISNNIRITHRGLFTVEYIVMVELEYIIGVKQYN